MGPWHDGYTSDMDQPTSIWNDCLEYAAASDVGLRRVNNQDAYTIVLAGSQDDFQQWGHLFMVADGMGAHAAGELASKIATDVVPLSYRKRPGQATSEAIISATLDANQQIHNRGLASPDFRGMGTTATTLLLLPAGAMVVHVGDSRAYRLRGNRLEQLTFDHSLVWEMRAAGQMPDSDVPGFISKNIITRSLGPNPAVRVDLEGPHPVQVGDTYLLCSDGLSGQVSDDEIGAVLRCLPPNEAVSSLVDLANLRGGPDNITVIVLRVLGPQIAQATSSDDALAAAPASIPPIHPVVWVAVGVAGLAAAALAVLGHPLMAIGSLLGGTAVGITALWRQFAAANRRALADNDRFGRGPYVTCECSPSDNLLARLVEIIRQLREAARDESWSIDWDRCDDFVAQATRAKAAGNLLDAARAYLRAISFLMSQLREQRTTGPFGAEGPGSDG